MSSGEKALRAMNLQSVRDVLSAEEEERKRLVKTTWPELSEKLQDRGKLMSWISLSPSAASVLFLSPGITASSMKDCRLVADWRNFALPWMKHTSRPAMPAPSASTMVADGKGFITSPARTMSGTPTTVLMKAQERQDEHAASACATMLEACTLIPVGYSSPSIRRHGWRKVMEGGRTRMRKEEREAEPYAPERATNVEDVTTGFISTVNVDHSDTLTPQGTSWSSTYLPGTKVSEERPWTRIQRRERPSSSDE
eukprot:768628-Hanusia_phi.AAC.6